jgi:hypothetical protein
MDYSFSKNLFLACFNLLWNILSYGYVGLILSIIFSLCAILYFIILIKNYKIILFLIKDKFSFLKNYIYLWVSEKINFIKYTIYMLSHQSDNLDKKKLIILIIIFIIVIGFLVFALMFVLDLAKNQYIDQTINESLNLTNM